MTLPLTPDSSTLIMVEAGRLRHGDIAAPWGPRTVSTSVYLPSTGRRWPWIVPTVQRLQIGDRLDRMVSTDAVAFRSVRVRSRGPEGHDRGASGRSHLGSHEWAVSGPWMGAEPLGPDRTRGGMNPSHMIILRILSMLRMGSWAGRRWRRRLHRETRMSQEKEIGE